MRTDLKHIEEALLTPTPKHIEEARRLAAETENAIIAILSPEMGSNEIYAQILKHIPLATLLAAQEEAVKENAELRAHNAALLAVAQAAKDVRENIIEHGSHDNWKTISKALSALEPLGVKV